MASTANALRNVVASVITFQNVQWMSGPTTPAQLGLGASVLTLCVRVSLSRPPSASSRLTVAELRVACVGT